MEKSQTKFTVNSKMEPDGSVDSGVESNIDSVQLSSTESVVNGYLESDHQGDDGPVEGYLDSSTDSHVQPDSTTGSQPVSGFDSASHRQPDSTTGEDIKGAVCRAMDVYSCLEHIHRFLDDLLEMQRYRQAYQVCADFLDDKYCIYCFMCKIYIIDAHYVFYEMKHLFPECIRNFLQQSEMAPRWISRHMFQ